MEKRSNKSLKTTIPIIGGMKQGTLSRQIGSLTEKWHGLTMMIIFWKYANIIMLTKPKLFHKYHTSFESRFLNYADNISY